MTTNPIPEPGDELVLKPCPFCGDPMMWLEDVVAFTHTQQTIETTLCKIATSIIDGDRAKWWNTRHEHIADNELVVPVARALCDELERQDLHVMGDGDDYVVIYQTPRINLAELARAAIAAMPELSSLQDKIRRLEEALRLGIPLIEKEREVTVSSHTVLYKKSPDLGKVVDPEAVELVESYDEFLNAARTALTDTVGGV